MSRKYKSSLDCKVETSHSAWRMPVDESREDLVKLPGYCVLTCLNGYQWAGSSTMTMDELEVLHAFLGDYIRENKP